MYQIGFIGLGHMGCPIAQGMSNLGYDVFAYDVYEKALNDYPGRKTHQLTDLAKHAKIIVTMLPSGQELMNIYQNLDFLNLLHPDVLLIDCSTIGPIAAKQFHALPFNTVDAPVSGGVIAAQNNQLTYMIGGLAAHVAIAEAIFKPMSKQIIHTGGPGSGQIAKTCNNMVLANTMIAVSEAFILAEKCGLDENTLLNVLKSSSGDCWVVEKYLPVPNIMENVPANHGYAHGFSNKMMYKDLKLAQQTAVELNLVLPLTQKVQDIYAELQSHGHEALDFSYIYQYLKDTKK
jgi:3-hydroxyisobutyrate dehydrogenase